MNFPGFSGPLVRFSRWINKSGAQVLKCDRKLKSGVLIRFVASEGPIKPYIVYRVIEGQVVFDVKPGHSILRVDKVRNVSPRIEAMYMQSRRNYRSYMQRRRRQNRRRRKAELAPE